MRGRRLRTCLAVPATLGEILRWSAYAIGRGYLRLAAWVMRRDRLLSGSERKFQALLEFAPDAMVIVNGHGHITLVNAETERLFGRRRGELVGQTMGELLPESMRARFRQHERSLRRDPSGDPVARHLELLARDRDGREFPVEISLSALETDRGVLVMCAIRDVSEARRNEERLRYLAEHDALTGLLNRHSFEAHLDRIAATCARHGTDAAVVLLDVDNFKDVNDTDGHAAGDELLRRLAVTLAGRLRATDIVARLGGDEFGLILDHTTPQEAQAVTRSVLDAVRGEVVAVDGRRLRATCSAGVASFSGGAQPEEVMVAADLALYDAKDRGRDRYAFHAPGAVEVAARQARASWTQRLRTTLDGGLLVPYAQPLLNVAKGSIDQFELLVRVEDADGTPIPPAAFLPTAERTGMVVELDRYMMETAVGLIAASQRSGSPSLSFAVNLSARSLADPRMISYIADKLASSGIDPRLLVFEITETAAISDMDAARRFALRLRDQGCALALDDFGTGFASFFHLKHLPLDWLKLDGEFVRTIVSSPADQVIVRHMADMGRHLGLQVAAECVENQRTLDLVTEYGVSRAQGFHIGKPVPVADLAAVHA